MSDHSRTRTRRGRRGGRKPVLHCSNCGTRGPDPCSEDCQTALDLIENPEEN